MSINIGDKVNVKGDDGVVKFIGTTQFASGTWYGIELTNSVGKNDGSVSDVRYFTCSKPGNFGIFVRRALIDTDSDVSNTTIHSSRVPLVVNASDSMDLSKLHKIIEKLQSKLKATTEDIKEYHNKLQVLQDERTEDKRIIDKLNSRFEMLTVEKSYASESLLEVQSQLEELQLKYDDLKYDYQILQEEMNLNKQIENEVKLQLNDSESPEIQVILTRNKQLEVALLNLQKLMESSELNMKTEIAELKALIKREQEQTINFAEVSEKLASANTIIESLQSQLDSTLDAEKLVEHFTKENEELSNKIKSLTKTIEELSELHDIDKSLEESQLLVEQQLREDINGLKEIIKQDKADIEVLEKRNKYVESRLQQFKQETSKASEGQTTSQQAPESLVFELRKLKLDNAADAIRIKISDVNLKILNERQEVLGLQPTNYEDIIAAIFQLKLNIEYVKIIVGVEKSVNLPNSWDYTKLQLYLSMILRLCEYNYESDALGHEFFDSLKGLENNLLQILDDVKKSNFANFENELITDFITQTSKLFDFQKKEYNYKVKFFTQFALDVLENEIKKYQFIVDNTRSQISYSEELSDLKSESTVLLKSLESLRKMILIIAKQLQIVKEDADIVNNNFNIDELLENLNISNDLLNEVYLCCLEENTLNFTKLCSEQNTSKTFKKITTLMQTCEDLLNRDFNMKRFDYASIYLAVEMEKTSIKDSSIGLVGKESYEKELSEFSLKLSDKERQLQDTKLNIELLESNMRKLDTQRTKQLSTLENELKEAAQVHENDLQVIEELKEKKQKLDNELNELLKSNSIFDIKKFQNLESENNSIDRLAFIEEIMFLRKMAVMNFDSTTKTEEDYSWLEPSILPTVSVTATTSAIEFQNFSSSIRLIATKTRLVRVRQNGWTQRHELVQNMHATTRKELQNKLLHGL
jgi:dynactin 1